MAESSYIAGHFRFVSLLADVRSLRFPAGQEFLAACLGCHSWPNMSCLSCLPGSKQVTHYGAFPAHAGILCSVRLAQGIGLWQPSTPLWDVIFLQKRCSRKTHPEAWDRVEGSAPAFPLMTEIKNGSRSLEERLPKEFCLRKPQKNISSSRVTFKGQDADSGFLLP